VWTADSRSLVFAGTAGDAWRLYSRRVEANERSHELFAFPRRISFPTGLSPDGRLALFKQNSGGGRGLNMVVLHLADRRTEPFEAAAESGRFSPDGRWIAYQSFESGRFDVFVRSRQGATRLVVSGDGGTDPWWRVDGRELFYVRGRTVMAVPVEPGEPLRLGTPRKLFEFAGWMAGTPSPTPGGSDFAVMPDGQHFLLNVLDENAPQSPITVVLNWTALLGR
jgi:Tol biopolymer transport system component